MFFFVDLKSVQRLLKWPNYKNVLILFIANKHYNRYSESLVEFKKKQNKNTSNNIYYLNAEVCGHTVSAVKSKPHIEAFLGEELLDQLLCPKKLAILDNHCDLKKA